MTAFSLSLQTVFLGYSVALGPDQKLFCPVLTSQRFEVLDSKAVSLARQLRLHFKTVPSIFFFLHWGKEKINYVFTSLL